MRNLILYSFCLFLAFGSFAMGNDVNPPSNSMEKLSASIDQLFLYSKEIETHPNPDIRSYADEDIGYPKTFLFIKNFPINKKITSTVKRLVQDDQRYTKICEFYINEQREIISTSDPREICHCFCTPSRSFLPGERIFCRFSTEEKDFEIETSFIPHPIRVQNKTGTVIIEAELIAFFPALYRFTFTGFQENEVIKSESISGAEKLKGSFKISKDLIVTLSPDVKGKKGGICKKIFTRASGEQIQVNLPWGVELSGYVEGNKLYKPN